MTSPNPIVSGSTSTTPQSTPNNTLGPDSFITLLTAQLQAQDPLSPMDPDQMVDELTSINTLQQVVQIRTDTDALASAVGAASSSTGAGSSSDVAAAAKSLAPAAAKLNYQLNSQVNSHMNSGSQSF